MRITALMQIFLPAVTCAGFDYISSFRLHPNEQNLDAALEAELLLSLLELLTFRSICTINLQRTNVSFCGSVNSKIKSEFRETDRTPGLK